jgi:hypothetical protein
VVQATKASMSTGSAANNRVIFMGHSKMKFCQSPACRQGPDTQAAQPPREPSLGKIPPDVLFFLKPSNHTAHQ